MCVGSVENRRLALRDLLRSVETRCSRVKRGSGPRVAIVPVETMISECGAVGAAKYSIAEDSSEFDRSSHLLPNWASEGAT